MRCISPSDTLSSFSRYQYFSRSSSTSCDASDTRQNACSGTARAATSPTPPSCPSTRAISRTLFCDTADPSPTFGFATVRRCATSAAVAPPSVASVAAVFAQPPRSRSRRQRSSPSRARPARCRLRPAAGSRGAASTKRRSASSRRRRFGPPRCASLCAKTHPRSRASHTSRGCTVPPATLSSCRYACGSVHSVAAACRRYSACSCCSGVGSACSGVCAAPMHTPPPPPPLAHASESPSAARRGAGSVSSDAQTPSDSRRTASSCTRTATAALSVRRCACRAAEARLPCRHAARRAWSASGGDRRDADICFIVPNVDPSLLSSCCRCSSWGRVGDGGGLQEG
eukprot:Rhum_TRINITY_DN14717_c17_g1::Rhum_TRINITY_DN14717_c17_g1_i2::g.114054::m.114054